jgi:HEAT repeat protein
VGRIGPKARRALPRLSAATTHADEKMRAESVRSLAAIGARAAAPALLRVLRGPDRPLHADAILGLQMVGVHAPADWMEGEEPYVRYWFAHAAGEQDLEEHKELPVPVLLTALKNKDAMMRDALRDTDANARRLAASALGRIGEQARPAIPDLLRALTDESAEVRRSAAEALRKIDPDALKPPAP